MKIICPSDDFQTKWAIDEATKLDGPVYIRLCRLATPIIYDDKNFEFGKACVHGNGTDATIFATGVTVSIALETQEKLQKEGKNVRVVDIHTIKPIDKETIIRCAKETKKLISVEDHNIIGGLGTAISEVLTDECPTKLLRLGINDTFGKSGKADDLLNYFQLNSEKIKNCILDIDK